MLVPFFNFYECQTLSHFLGQCQKPVLYFSGEPLAKKPHLGIRFEGHQDSRKSSGHASGSSSDSENSHGGQHYLHILMSITSLTLSSLVV